MDFKEGLGWKACYDEERNLYTAQRKWRGSYHLYEIDKEIYEQLGIKEEDGYDADKLIMKGRCLFESDDDYYTSPYYTIHDENYHELAPWSSAKWIAEKTDVMNKRDRLVKNFPGLYLCYGTSKVDHIRNVFGVSDRESNKKVAMDTMFPACSISKFVTAICVMKMHELGTINIDDSVNDYLHSWKLLTSDGKESTATIRSILSHTAGILDGEGFYGLRLGEPEISLIDVLE